MKRQDYISPATTTEELLTESQLLGVSDIYTGELGVRAPNAFDAFENADQTGTVQGMKQIMTFFGMP